MLTNFLDMSQVTKANCQTGGLESLLGLVGESRFNVWERRIPNFKSKVICMLFLKITVYFFFSVIYSAFLKEIVNIELKNK